MFPLPIIFISRCTTLIVGTIPELCTKAAWLQSDVSSPRVSQSTNSLVFIRRSWAKRFHVPSFLFPLQHASWSYLMRIKRVSQYCIYGMGVTAISSGIKDKSFRYPVTAIAYEITAGRAVLRSFQYWWTAVCVRYDRFSIVAHPMEIAHRLHVCPDKTQYGTNPEIGGYQFARNYDRTTSIGEIIPRGRSRSPGRKTIN